MAWVGGDAETYRENLRQAAAAGNPSQLSGELQTYHSLHAAAVIAHRQAQEAKQGELQRLENAVTHQARALLTNALIGSTAHAITERKQLAATAVVQARQQNTSTTNRLHEARDSYVKARVCNGMVCKRGGGPGPGRTAKRPARCICASEWPSRAMLRTLNSPPPRPHSPKTRIGLATGHG